MIQAFTCHKLPSGHAFFTGRVPAHLQLQGHDFDAEWAGRPPPTRIRVCGQWREPPRRIRAVGMPYEFSGVVFPAEPTPAWVNRLLPWARSRSPSTNGGLLNYYEGPGDFIGLHRDSRKNMIRDSPIIMLSFGATRTFRLQLWKGSGSIDFTAAHGTAFILPFDTNLVWQHGVPKTEDAKGRRISLTLRSLHE